MCPRTECSILRATLVIMLLTLTFFVAWYFQWNLINSFSGALLSKLQSNGCNFPQVFAHHGYHDTFLRAAHWHLLITKSWAGGRNSYWTREEAWGLPKYQNKSEGGISCCILPLCFKKLRHQIFIYFLIFESQANKHEEVMQHVSCYVR